MTLFAIIAVLLTIVAVGLVVAPLLRSATPSSPLPATLIALFIPVAVLVTYLSVSNFDWRAPPAAGAAAAASGAKQAGSMEEAIASLERKLEASPGDEEGWVLLGSSYLSVGRPEEAIKAYQKGLDLSGGRNVAARLGVAEARIVLDPGAIAGAAGDDIEAVLREEPRNPKALWYGGLLALAKGQPAVARERWTVLLDLDPPARIRQIIETQLADLDAGSKLLAPGGAPAGSGTPPAIAAGTTASEAISIKVSLGAELQSRAPASAPLFVFVRDAQNPGPPLAVVRRQAGELPLTLQVSDADVMMPGRTLASVREAKIVARIAKGGDPIAKPGDLYGEADWTRSPSGAGPVTIVINQTVGP